VSTFPWRVMDNVPLQLIVKSSDKSPPSGIVTVVVKVPAYVPGLQAPIGMVGLASPRVKMLGAAPSVTGADEPVAGDSLLASFDREEAPSSWGTSVSNDGLGPELAQAAVNMALAKKGVARESARVPSAIIEVLFPLYWHDQRWSVTNRLRSEGNLPRPKGEAVRSWAQSKAEDEVSRSGGPTGCRGPETVTNRSVRYKAQTLLSA
jgi:hypothetical protein